MRIIHSPLHAEHAPGFFLVRGAPSASPERPERFDLLFEAAVAAGHEPAALAPGVEAPLARVHTERYLEFLRTVHQRWSALPGAAAEVIPNVHPPPAPAAYPESIVGRAGVHMLDTACPIGAGTWRAACASAACSFAAAHSVLDGARAVYALCRPPGHHAYADSAGGFCYLNNSAIAAEGLRERFARVAVVDVDVHHGNGTQGIFYAREDVFTLSLHADPRDYYPFFCGYRGETGEGAGEGRNLNVPLALGTADAPYLAALDVALGRLSRFAPQALVIALGLDAFEHDPLQGMRITTDGFGRIGARIGALGLPSVLVQEGGYPHPSLGINLAAFLDGFEAAHGRGA